MMILVANPGAQVIALQGVTISAGGDLSSLYQSKLAAATSRTWNALWIAAETGIRGPRNESRFLKVDRTERDSPERVLIGPVP
jgi:hypothetical protein